MYIVKHLEMLIVLHLYSFLLPYDSAYMSLGDSETATSYNHFK